MRALLISIFFFISAIAFAQSYLKPNFDAEEYRTMLKISERQMDSVRFPLNLPWPANFNRIYISPVKGMDNRFEIWVNAKTKLAVISIRGTTTESISWVENVYSGMIPAQGRIKIDHTNYVEYKVAENPNAYVHAGWMIGMMSIAPDMISQIKKQYEAGYRNFIIFGHSQGGAIAFLFRSFIEYMPSALPSDIIIKTMCSAAPKPGNLYYAYDYEYITQGGWGLRIVNTLDWVPEMPFAIQTLNDINALNPLLRTGEIQKEIGFIKGIYLKSILRKLKKSSKKAMKAYQKYLGRKVFLLVKKHLPSAELPHYSSSFNYSTTGTPIILKPGEAYLNNYLPKATMDIFNHHMMYPYFLACLESFPERD